MTRRRRLPVGAGAWISGVNPERRLTLPRSRAPARAGHQPRGRGLARRPARPGRRDRAASALQAVETLPERRGRVQSPGVVLAGSSRGHPEGLHAPGAPYAGQIAALDCGSRPAAGTPGSSRPIRTPPDAARARGAATAGVGAVAGGSAAGAPLGLCEWPGVPLDELAGLPDPRPYDKATELAALVTECGTGPRGLTGPSVLSASPAETTSAGAPHRGT